ncbi:MAG: hypothetical protein HY791_35640 [Deltaproteobacteria bacterium]|nr:hypothetical protein [Deltaproteobacteria bacterium]
MGRLETEWLVLRTIGVLTFATSWAALVLGPLAPASLGPDRLARFRRTLGFVALACGTTHAGLAINALRPAPVELVTEPNLRSGVAALSLLTLAGLVSVRRVGAWLGTDSKIDALSGVWLALPLALLHAAQSSWIDTRVLVGLGVASLVALGSRLARRR